LLPQAFSIDIPQELMKELLRCKSSEAIYCLGIEWAVLQCKELLENGARAVHFYTMGKADNIREIIRRAF
ncbi:MAG: methylenetetrahydrofolate reductase, partial [Bacteroidales bacterium]|nr:methylenetetrahydrofolate reductase [Bacteroidales bacterium]